MPAIACPYCNHSMTVREAKPGTYKPKCAKCGQSFALRVHDDPAKPWSTAKLAPPAAVEQTLPPTSAAKTVAEPSSPPSVPRAAEATLPPPSPPRASSPQAVEATLPPSQPTANPLADPNATADFAANLTRPQRAIEATEAHTAAAVASSTSPRHEQPLQPITSGTKLPGYELLGELGRGAMGAVYKARQLSLDRLVALKVIQPQWASNPTFIARFTREAYAAAQLSHHNVVQIYDLGSSSGSHFFSMEFVPGDSLDHVVKSQGNLDAEVAIGYVLQAARGLQFAHQHGMVHRDVKPANLLLSERGVVKVADLGLVKTPQAAEQEVALEQEQAEAAAAAKMAENAAAKSSSARTVVGQSATARSLTGTDVTMVNVAMGTPAYMAPEQAINAAGVDHRADIYSLGCTLYVLLTGRPPFEGATANEVITKHKSEPIVRPDAIIKRLDKRLSDIVVRMVAKRPEDRYPSLAEVIHDLEAYLGIQSTGPFSPREEQVTLLEQSVKQFGEAKFAKIRSLAILSVTAGFTALGLGISFWSLNLGLGLMLVPVMAALVYFAVSGFLQRTFLFDKARLWLSTTRTSDWLTWGAGGLVALVVLLLLGWLITWMVLLPIAVGLAVALYFAIDRPLAQEREAALAPLHGLLKSFRLKGVEEDSLRQFVARYSGDQWEELFEALFGYEAKIAARERFGRTEQGKRRSKFRAWRDPLIAWIDRRVTRLREERDRKHLQIVEEKGLEAQGIDPLQARRQAKRMAEALVDEAAEVRAAAVQPSAQTVADPAAEAIKKRARIKAMLHAARQGSYEGRSSKLTSTALSPLAFLFGGKVRFILGTCLLLGFALWAQQNGLFSNVEQIASDIANKTPADVKASLQNGMQIPDTSSTTPLPIPLIGPMVSSYNAAVAGLLLMVLGMFGGWRMSLFAIPAAAVMLVGALYLPDLGLPGGPATLALAIGVPIAVLGFFFGGSES